MAPIEYYCLYTYIITRLVDVTTFTEAAQLSDSNWYIIFKVYKTGYSSSDMKQNPLQIEAQKQIL